MNFVSSLQLITDITEWTKSLPEFDLIVGVPRSGLLPATLLALHYNVQLAELDSFRYGHLFRTGPRGRALVIRKVLVVDDSVSSGQSLQKIREGLGGSDFQISFGTVYASPECQPDYFYRLVPTPRIFQWNIMHHTYLSNSCMDIDGVLCENPIEAQNDDGPRYLEFLKNTRSIVRPTVRIKNLVTCRLEKYRSLTKDWLWGHDIEYQNLFMMNYPDKASRVKAGRHAEYKAQIYANSNTILFIEDSLEQARKIAKITSKPVLCTSSWMLF